MIGESLADQVPAIQETDYIVGVIGKSKPCDLMCPIRRNTYRKSVAAIHCKSIDREIVSRSILKHSVHTTAIDAEIVDYHIVVIAVTTLQKNCPAIGIDDLGILNQHRISPVDREGILDMVVLVAAGAMLQNAVVEVSVAGTFV